MTDTNVDTAAEGSEDRDLVLALGRAIWRSRNERGASTEDRKASWRDGQAGFRQEARKLLRMLDAEGLTLTRDPNAAAGAED